jgi:hypothetical protein
MAGTYKSTGDYMELTQAKLKEVLEYNPETGVFIRKSFSGNNGAGAAKIGEPAGALDDRGYLRIRVYGKKYRAHRLAWFWVHGEFPTGIDHINGIKTDNRISNLRLANQLENSQNRLASRNSTSKYLGVSKITATGKWRAQIGFANKRHHIGFFDSEEEAYEAYKKTKAEMHKFNPVPR